MFSQCGSQPFGARNADLARLMSRVTMDVGARRSACSAVERSRSSGMSRAPSSRPLSRSHERVRHRGLSLAPAVAAQAEILEPREGQARGFLASGSPREVSYEPSSRAFCAANSDSVSIPASRSSASLRSSSATTRLSGDAAGCTGWFMTGCAGPAGWMGQQGPGPRAGSAGGGSRARRSPALSWQPDGARCPRRQPRQASPLRWWSRRR
jgi:hypothetical protein